MKTKKKIKMEQQLKQIKKKKKRLLTINYKDNIEVEDIPSNIYDLRNKLIKIFRSHIGASKGLTGWELLALIYKEKLEEMNDYERFFYFNIIKRIIRVLRKERLIIVVNQKRKFFTLQTMNEYVNLKSLLDRDIKNMERLKEDAYEWVRLEKWRNI